jgi:hypothetical protein
MRLRYPLALLLIAGFFIVGQNDYENEVLEEQDYIERVCQGVHKDYLSIQPSCPPVE